MNRSYFHVDLSLLIPSVILVILGLSGILSLSFELFKLQISFVLASLTVFFFFSQLNYKSVKNFPLHIYIISVVLFIIVLFIGIESRGSVRWLELFGRGIQFSEILKPFLAISLATFLAKRDSYSFKNFYLVLLFLFPIFFLIFIQPDLGNALIYLLTTLFMLFAFGFPLRYFMSLIILSALSFPVFWQFLRSYQKQRILTFLELKVDPLGTSYNAIQSVIAVGSGMLFGKGFGQGTQSILRFLPERHTDFIFATLTEELGLVGSVMIFATFFFLLYRILIISHEAKDRFVKLFSMLAFFLITTQFFVNAGMNVGIVPIVGVSLPFVSYGGSSLLANFIFLGILSSMSREVRTRDTLEIR